MPKEIEFTIHPDGEVEIDLKGFMGRSCSNVVDELTKALGEQVKRSKRPEYYVSTPVKRSATTRHGNNG